MSSCAGFWAKCGFHRHRGATGAAMTHERSATMREVPGRDGGLRRSASTSAQCDRQSDSPDSCRRTDARRVRGEVNGTAITSAGGSDGSRAQHAAGDAERSEAASAARSARENDGAAATPCARKRNGPRRRDDDAARDALRTMQRP